MLQFWKTNLDNTIVHYIGNKAEDEGYVLSNSHVTINENQELKNTLLNFFLKSFKDLPTYSFSHPADLEMNVVFNTVSEIFDSPKKLIKSSQNLAKILYDYSAHPKIKSGELYVALFSDCDYNGTIVNAIGIFKSETKEIFLKVDNDDQSLNLFSEEGISTNKLDKGCLVLNINKQDGYIVYSVDNTSKGADAVYWKDDFLKLKANSDEYHNTYNILQLTKQYVTSSLPESFEVSKTDQADYLNRSVSYFKHNEDFNIKDFEKEVFQEPDIIKSFRKFGSAYVDKNDIDISDSFSISNTAVKKQSRAFKSVLKLDRNFHIYIHGDTDLIEQGFDTKTGKKFYKIYFDKET